MSRRDSIKMTPDEVLAYLAEQRVINVATISPNGRPHVAPLWYVPWGDGVATWTYRRSQKVANLQRSAQATVLVESGETYEELRGVSMESDVEIIEDAAAVAEFGRALAQRYGGTSLTDELVAKQAGKRVGLVFRPTKIVSWNHGKLGGLY